MFQDGERVKAKDGGRYMTVGTRLIANDGQVFYQVEYDEHAPCAAACGIEAERDLMTAGTLVAFRQFEVVQERETGRYGCVTQVRHDGTYGVVYDDDCLEVIVASNAIMTAVEKTAQPRETLDEWQARMELKFNV